MTKKEFLTVLGHVLYPESKEIHYNASSSEVIILPPEGDGYGHYVPNTYIQTSRDKYTEIVKITLKRILSEFSSEEVQRVQAFMKIMCTKSGYKVIVDGKTKIVILVHGDYPWKQVTYIGVS